MLDAVKEALQPYPTIQITFSVILAIACFYIMVRARADRIRRSYSGGDGQSGPAVEAYFDGPIMAAYRVVRENQKTLERLEQIIQKIDQHLAVMAESVKLRQDRENEMWSDNFRLLRDIKEKVERLESRRR